VIAAALVMAKAPRPGEVKTRLEPLLGPDGCAVLQARLLARAASVAARSSPGAAWMAVDPPDAAELLGDLAGDGVRLFGQSGGHLGERLSAATTHVFRRHDGPVVVVGTDSPTIRSGHFQAARETLWAGNDVAIGPALDGGYYLIAMVRPLPELFALPPGAWGGERVLGLTLRAARAAGLKVGLIEPARDLDTPDDAAQLLASGELPEEVAELLRVPAGP
jgi:rSAM/selenodomain-associated transferase 1